MKVAAALVLATACVGCSSWNTGSGDVFEAEKTCLDTIEVFARAAERCGAEYRASYDRLLKRDANGDCKNVRTIRDETELRQTCFAFVQTQSCDDLTSGVTDASCARQLQRPP
ncbi:MAG: hypothetical protein JWP87_862 [Labilithrix sp.]|nr:hypothetical protein [Labilithrix sp.]